MKNFKNKNIILENKILVIQWSINTILNYYKIYSMILTIKNYTNN